MLDNDPFQSWKQWRARAHVPEDFTDRVMTHLQEYEAQKARGLVFRSWLLAVLSSRVGKIAICAVACVTCALRMMSVFAIFLADKKG